jgi:hypothetical protein
VGKANGKRKLVKSPDYNYPATMARMALFTLILEFDGGTYISQFRAASVVRVVARYPSQLLSNRAVFTLAVRKRLAAAFSAENPVAIEGVRNVWCCSASIGKRFALLNIVATAHGQ